MSDYVITVSKNDKDAANSNEPNDFIFHSSYNTFKIIKTGIKTCSVTTSINVQTFTEAHGLDFTPLVTAFAKANDRPEAIAPNSSDIESADEFGMYSTGLQFITVGADATNVIFTFLNDTSVKTVKVRYYCLEAI